MPGAPHYNHSSMEWAVHLRLPPVRISAPSISSPYSGTACPRTVRRDSFPAPERNHFRSSTPERFNLVVPTSLIEKAFDVESVLQRGLKVVFKLSASGCAHSTQAAPAQQLLEPVHGCISRHTNPIGLTSYRVCGQQPSGLAAGCSLMGWSAQDGMLVVELITPPPQIETPAKNAATAPARRLFGDCLPSPATIRKELRSRATGAALSPLPALTQCVPPAPLHQRQQSHSASEHQQQGAPVDKPEFPASQPLPPGCSLLVHPATLAGSPGSQGASVVPDSEAAVCVPPSDSEGGNSESAFLSRLDSTEVNNGMVPQELKSAAHPRPRIDCSAASESYLPQSTSAEAAPQRPKRYRRCPMRLEAVADCTSNIKCDVAPSCLHLGIDLLLAAHEALSQEGSRPKRTRQPKIIFEI